MSLRSAPPAGAETLASGTGGSVSSRRGKIGVLYSYSYTHIDTGSPKALISMVESLDKTRFAPYFLAPSRGPLCQELEKRGAVVVERAARPIDVRHPFESLRRVFELGRLLTELGIDVVHVNEFGWNLDLAFAARLSGRALVLHFHNPARVRLRNLHWLLASRVILVSEGQKRTIEGFDRVRSKSVVIHNAVDLEAFARAVPAKQSLGLPDNVIVIGTVAQVCRRKGIDLLLDTAARVIAEEPRAFFVVVGPDAVGEEAFAKKLREAVDGGPLKGRVLFAGSRQDIPGVLAALDIFFLPTRAEPFGLVIIEAMAAGLPVVASAVGGIPEIIRSPQEGYLVAPGDCEGYASALLALVRDRELRRRIGEAARAGLEGRFDAPSLSARLWTVYADAMGGSVSRGTS